MVIASLEGVHMVEEDVQRARSFLDDYNIDDLNESFVWDIVCGDNNDDDYGNSTGLLPVSRRSVVSRVDNFRFFVDVYIVGVVCVFGFLGNALTIAVLKWDNEKANTTSWLLQSLALVDSFYLLSCLFIQPIKALHDLTDRLGAFSEAFLHMEPYLWPLAAVAQTATVWMILLITIDRYIAVCKPFKNKLRSLTHAKVSVFFVFAFALIYNIPHFFERYIIYVRNDCTGVTTAELRKSLFTNSSLYFILYKTLCYFLFRTFGPLLLLTILNHRLIKSLKTMKKRRDRLTKSSTRQKENITLMLVVVISVFIVCELPDVCFRLTVMVSGLVPDRIHLDHSIVYCANSLVNMLLSVNSAVNFIIYCLVGKKFRRILARRICCRTDPVATAPATAVDGPSTALAVDATALDQLHVERFVPEMTSVDHVISHVVSDLSRSKQRSI